MVSFKRIVLGLWGLAVCVATGASAARVRKSWADYSLDEKKLYIGAVQSAMKSGGHWRFAAMHSDTPSYEFAHRNCGFLLWHRRFLLAYENMLRDQGPQYANVTVPYWNYFNDHNKQMAADVDCNSFSSCSDFLREMGDSVGGMKAFSPSTGAAVVRGSCSENTDLGSVSCANPNGTAGANCQQCLLRGPWKTTYHYMTVVQQMILNSLIKVRAASKTRNPHAALSTEVENGFHNGIHNDLSGAMGTRGSPFDPIFYSHHGTVDLLLYIHNRCYYSNEGPSASRRFDLFQTCSITTVSGSTVTILPSNGMTMLYSKMLPDLDPVIGKYFKGLNLRYSAYVDAQAIGDSSYSYVLDKHLQNLLKQASIECPAELLGTRRLESEQTVSDTTAAGNSLTVSDDHGDNPDDHDSDAVAQLSKTLIDCGKEVQLLDPQLSREEVQTQTSIIECEAIRQRQGFDFDDYTDQFRAEFNIPAGEVPFCFALLSDVQNQDLPILTSDNCRRKYGELTNTDLLDGFGKQLFSSREDFERHQQQVLQRHRHRTSTAPKANLRQRTRY